MSLEQNKVWKDMPERPSSDILPQSSPDEPYTFKDLISHQSKYLKGCDPHIAFNYEKGVLLYKGAVLKDDQYEQVLQTCINSVFELLREDIYKTIEDVEERQYKLEQISTIQSVFKSGIDVLRTHNLKLDINSVISILYGYVAKHTQDIVKQYEDRQSTKH